MKIKIQNNVHRLINHSSIVLITSSFKNIENIMTVAWYQIIDIDPVIISISIGIKKFTHELIEKSNKFGINLPTNDLIDQVWKCGKQSGREVDKFKISNFSKFSGPELDVPLIEECIANLECEVVFKKTFNLHTVFFGLVHGAYVEEGTFKDTWLVDEKNLIFPFHLGGNNIIVNSPQKFEVR